MMLLAVSLTGALEGAWQIASGNLKSLSKQKFVACSMHHTVSVSMEV